MRLKPVVASITEVYDGFIGVVSEPLPEGPLYSTVSLSALQQAGWTAHYDESYAHHTTSSIIRAIPQGACVFVGASNGDVDIVDVGAFADTASVVLETLENAPHYARGQSCGCMSACVARCGAHWCSFYTGMYWYFTPSESFGFSASSVRNEVVATSIVRLCHCLLCCRGQVIQQSSADVGSTQAESRVSWHLDIRCVLGLLVATSVMPDGRHRACAQRGRLSCRKRHWLEPGRYCALPRRVLFACS